MGNNGRLIGVKCPVCGEPVSIRADIAPGHPGSYFEPPDPPSLNDADKPEYNCDCREKIEKNGVRQRYYGVKDGHLNFMPVNDLLDAYDAEIEFRIDEADFEFDTPDPAWDER